MNDSVTGSEIILALEDHQKLEEDLTEALEHVRDHPGTREDIVYSPEMYQESANAAAITSYILQRARAKHLEKQQWNLKKPLENRNDFVLAIFYFTGEVTDQGILVDELSQDKLKRLLIETLESSLLHQRAILTGLGYGPERDLFHSKIEESYTRCFSIFADFVKLALK